MAVQNTLPVSQAVPEEINDPLIAPSISKFRMISQSIEFFLLTWISFCAGLFSYAFINRPHEGVFFLATAMILGTLTWVKKSPNPWIKPVSIAASTGVTALLYSLGLLPGSLLGVSLLASPFLLVFFNSIQSNLAKGVDHFWTNSSTKSVITSLCALTASVPLAGIINKGGLTNHVLAATVLTFNTLFFFGASYYSGKLIAWFLRNQHLKSLSDEALAVHKMNRIANKLEALEYIQDSRETNSL